MWGEAYDDQFAEIPQDEPGAVYAPTQYGTSSWMSIGSAAGFVVAAIRADGALFTWGADEPTRIDFGSGLPRSSPVQFGTSSWTFICGGNSAGMFAAIRADGTLHTWGYNGVGQLGLNLDGNFAEVYEPTQISSSNSWTMVSMGAINVYALATDNTVWAWGTGIAGRNGDNTIISRSSPVQVALPPLVMP